MSSSQLPELRYQGLRGCSVGILLIFALLQWNDPDPVQWIFLYSMPAILIGIPRRQNLQFLRKIRSVLTIVYLILAVYLFPREYKGVGEMRAGTPEIEYARESLGLIIAIVLYWLGEWANEQIKVSKLSNATEQNEASS